MIKAVIDSTALIYLTSLELTIKLSQFFGVVFVPGVVEDEVCRKHRFRYRLKTLYDTGVFRRCKTANEYNRRLLELDDGIHPGEADALAQAQEQEIPVFIGDEKAARNSAKRKGKIVVGTAGILAKLYVQGFVQTHPLQMIRRLRRSEMRCRITDEVVAEAMRNAHYPIVEV